MGLERRKKIIARLNDLDVNKNHRKCHNKTIESSSISVTKNPDSIFDHKIKVQLFSGCYSSPSDYKLIECNSGYDLVEVLKLRSKETIKSKDDNSLITPAIFGNKKRPDGLRARTQANVQYAWCIMLDIDDGQMTPDDFKLIYPDLKMYCFNTYSGEGRYRVLIPVSDFITKEAYKDITKSIVAEVERSGFKDEKKCKEGELAHGIDMSKLGPQSLFYLPCKAKTKKRGDSFFIEQDGNVLDVVAWLESPLHFDSEDLPEITPAKNPKEIKPDDKIVERFMSEYQSTPAGQGLRNRAYFVLACKLKKYGCDYDQVESMLIEADHDGSRQKKNSIKYVLRSIQRYGL